MGGVELIAARPDQKAVLDNLFQLYVHDFSEQWAGEDRGELEEDGRFGADGFLDLYWGEAGREALLIRASGHLAGFALINAHSHMGRDVDHAVAEFFVVRKHRRDGVGSRAAAAVFAARPGRWEAAVARRNTAALAFWRGVIGDHPQARNIEAHDRNDADWNGTVFRFDIAPA